MENVTLYHRRAEHLYGGLAQTPSQGAQGRAVRRHKSDIRTRMGQ